MKRYLLTGFVGLSLLLTAYGGGVSGGGGGTPPPSITVTVEDPAGSFAVAAYQVGSGPWQLLDMNGSDTKTATFSLGGQSKYGVAVYCGNSVNVIQATNSEVPNPKIACSTVPFTVEVSISNITLAQGDQVCVNGHDPMDVSCKPAATSTSITANLEPGSNRDLLITLKDGSGRVKVAKVQKGVNVTSGGSTTVSLGSSDQLLEVSFSAPNAPTEVFYLSANNTAFGALNASPTSYRPVSGFSGGDRYVAIAAYATASNAWLFTAQPFSNGFPSLVFPAPWNPGSLTIGQNPHPSVSGLSRADGDLQAYQIDLWLPGLSYTTVLSKGWLDGSTSYNVPDLSNLLYYTVPSSGSGGLKVIALLSNKGVFQDDPAVLVADGDYLRGAVITTNYRVGEGQITLP